MDRLNDLAEKLVAQRNRIGHACEIGTSASAASDGMTRVKLDNFTYWRGQVQVSIRNITLEGGKVYAITGANGCGKSTFFSLLASCRGFAALPAGMEMTSIVEITQQMYCPLYIEPITWLQRKTRSEELRIQELLSQLDFSIGTPGSELDFKHFQGVETDWYSKLSGGQRSKVELVSHIFLRERCPDILLIDEALSPLDFASKALVQQKLRTFCNESVILVIHHQDAHSQCLSSAGFFDDNLHFDHGIAALIGTCEMEKRHQNNNRQKESIRVAERKAHAPYERVAHLPPTMTLSVKWVGQLSVCQRLADDSTVWAMLERHSLALSSEIARGLDPDT